MRNIRLTISYKGTAYAGWQKQKNAVSIEEKISDAITAVTGEKITLYGAGRTDAGVHALAQTANFFTLSNIPAERFKFALNAHLPMDIRVMKSEEAPMDFHSRYSAHEKIYEYRIFRGEVASPFYNEISWQVPYQLDISEMKKASHFLIGEHDFRCFMASGSGAKTTVRRIDTIDFYENGPLLIIQFMGNGFLYNMIRIIVGTLEEIGRGKRDAESMKKILESRDRLQAGVTAPAKGLLMKAVLYD